MNNENFNFLVECAVKSPSGHNTQPWKFENSANEIIIHPDFKRALPVVDAENYELYISLGCALENMLIGAKQKGYACTIKYPQKPEGNIHVEFIKDDKDGVARDILFDEIPKRQVTKSKYNDKNVPSDVLQQISSCFDFEGISLLVLDGKKNFEKIIPLIIEASNLQFGNKDFVNELVSCCRFSKSEAKKTKDGIWSATMGMPGLGRFFGSMIMKNFITAKSEAKRLTELLDHTQGLVLFISNTYNEEAWIKTGRAFQRFGLLTTHLGLSHAHLNMPCEESKMREKLSDKLNLNGKHPLLLIRYGYADKMPYSFRRNTEDVIV